MGDGNAFYEEMGIDVDPGTEEGFYRHYTTRYLIWANGAARALLGKDLQGQGPDISPCYLMNLVFQQLGWEGPAFMQAMTGMMNMFPVVSSASGLTMVDGRLTADIPEDRRALFQEFLYLQQYWRNEFLYEWSGKVPSGTAGGNFCLMRGKSLRYTQCLGNSLTTWAASIIAVRTSVWCWMRRLSALLIAPPARVTT